MDSAKETILKSNTNGHAFLTSTITTMYTNIRLVLQRLQPWLRRLSMVVKKIVTAISTTSRQVSLTIQLNVMRKAGVDMEKEDYLNDAFAVFERRLNEFEALVEKLGLA